MVRAFLIALTLLVPTVGSAAQYAAETERLVDATADLFDRLEAGADAGADRPRIELRLKPQPMSFGAPDGALRPEYGPVRDLTGYRVTWYDTERLIGTVDFVGTWGDGRHLICGYVSWDMSGDAPALDDLVADYLETGALAASAEDDAHLALIEANCAYGEIEANFALARGN